MAKSEPHMTQTEFINISFLDKDILSFMLWVPDQNISSKLFEEIQAYSNYLSRNTQH